MYVAQSKAPKQQLMVAVVKLFTHVMEHLLWVECFSYDIFYINVKGPVFYLCMKQSKTTFYF